MTLGLLVGWARTGLAMHAQLGCKVKSFVFPRREGGGEDKIRSYVLCHVEPFVEVYVCVGILKATAAVNPKFGLSKLRFR